MICNGWWTFVELSAWASCTKYDPFIGCYICCLQNSVLTSLKQKPSLLLALLIYGSSKWTELTLSKLLVSALGSWMTNRSRVYAWHVAWLEVVWPLSRFPTWHYFLGLDHTLLSDPLCWAQDSTAIFTQKGKSRRVTHLNGVGLGQMKKVSLHS